MFSFFFRSNHLHWTDIVWIFLSCNVSGEAAVTSSISPLPWDSLVCANSLQSCPTLCDPIDCSHAPLSMGFSRQEYWSRWPFPPPGDLSDPETEPVSLMSPALAGRFFTTSTIWEALKVLITYLRADQDGGCRVTPICLENLHRMGRTELMGKAMGCTLYWVQRADSNSS